MASDKDASGQLNFVTSPFDAIHHMDGEREFWRARELSKILGYNRWENFENVIAKAKITCKYNGREVDDQFREVTKLIRAATRNNFVCLGVIPGSQRIFYEPWFLCYQVFENKHVNRLQVKYLGRSFILKNTLQAACKLVINCK